MIRLYILVEGLTEQQFVDELIYGHLTQFDVYCTTKRLDGISTFETFARELRTFFRDRSSDARFTTMSITTSGRGIFRVTRTIFRMTQWNA
jgi:hypothetical protein